MTGADAWSDPTTSTPPSTAPTPSCSPSPSRPRPTGSSTAYVLDRLADHAWVVNVARGRHIVTDDLVAALRDGTHRRAPDSTSPSPSRCREGHPLWSLPNVIITPHVGNTPDMAVPLLSARITENVRRWGAGEELLGPVDVDAGY